MPNGHDDNERFANGESAQSSDLWLGLSQAQRDIVRRALTEEEFPGQWLDYQRPRKRLRFGQPLAKAAAALMFLFAWMRKPPFAIVKTAMIYATAGATVAVPLLYLANRAYQAYAAPKVFAPPKGILLQAFFDPDDHGMVYWDALILAASKIDTIAVVSPDSGPGKARVDEYGSTILKFAHAGGHPIGYVHTAFGARRIDDVKAEIDRWKRLYPEIKGIFIDQQAENASNEKGKFNAVTLAYYKEITRHARKVFPGGLIVSNPGHTPSSNFFTPEIADIICINENRRTPENVAPVLPAGNPVQFAVMCAQVDREGMQTILKNLGGPTAYVYLTDGEGDNPWDGLPTYYEQMIEQILQMQREYATKTQGK